MTRNTMFLVGLALVGCGSASAAEAPAKKASGSAELTNAGGMLAPITTSNGEAAPLDAVGLSIVSDGKSLRFVATLKDPPGAFAKAPVTLLIDTDNNQTTGIKGNSGEVGGFEYRLELMLCIEYQDHSTACAGGSTNSAPAKRYSAAELNQLKGDSEFAENVSILSALAFPGERKAQQYPVDGKTITASIDYTDIGVKPGQTIRLLPRKTGGYPSADAPKFDSVLLTLK